MKKNHLYKYLLITIILGPILLLEILLRLFHFTYYPTDTGLIIPSEYTMFQRAGDFYTDSTHIRFKADKPQDEYRTFVLGGSSVANLGGLCNHKDWLKILQQMVQEKVRFHKVNIIGLGYQSWGTNRLLLLFNEALNYSPDLIIIYAGHNEFEEEYMKHIFKRPPSLMHFHNRLLSISKIYQFICLGTRKIILQIAHNQIDALKDTKPPFPPQSHKKWGLIFNKQQIYDNFSYNLNQIVRIAKNQHLPIILSTVAYNRRYPPHAPTKKEGFQQCELLLETKNLEHEARVCFEKEVSSDKEPHRASQEINQIVQQIAKFYKIPLADVDAAVVAKAADHIPGHDLFKDWCHLNETGNHILIMTFYKTILTIKNEINLQ